MNSTLIQDQIQCLMSKASLACSQQQLEQLTKLVELLVKWNQALNLTAIRDPEKMVVLHILDSAVVSPLISSQMNNIGDVGTGAGFPGLVLAILNPDKKFTLIDSVAKKLSFVRTAMVTIGLENVTIINDRCENIQLEQKFDCIFSRAFAPLERIVNWCHQLLADDGKFIAMKANLEKNEVEDLPALAKIDEIIDLKVPSLEAKRIAVIMSLNK